MQASHGAARDHQSATRHPAPSFSNFTTLAIACSLHHFEKIVGLKHVFSSVKLHTLLIIFAPSTHSFFRMISSLVTVNTNSPRTQFSCNARALVLVISTNRHFVLLQQRMGYSFYHLYRLSAYCSSVPPALKTALQLPKTV